jgi:nucleoside-diphosphate-sugar epimerase
VPTSVSPTIVVTGAQGFVGRRVVELLAPRAGALRAGMFEGGPAVTLPSSATPVPLDVMSTEQIAAAVRGADAVVHCAMGDARTTMEGTKNLLAVARRENVRRVVHLSSAVVYGKVTGIVDERRPLQSDGWSYTDWKIVSERDCEAARAGGLAVAVLRPSIIYGPRALTWAVELGDRLTSGGWGSLGRFGDGICNLIFIDDLVEAIWLCCTHDAAAGGVYNVNGTHLVTWNEFFSAYARALGLPPLRAHRPETVVARALAGDALRASGRAAALLTKKRGQPGGASGAGSGAPTGLLARARLLPRWRDVNGLYARKVTYEDGAIRRALGYRPTVQPEQGLAEMARWYQAERGATA